MRILNDIDTLILEIHSKVKEYQKLKKVLKKKNIKYEELGMQTGQPPDKIRVDITQNGEERVLIYNSITDEIKFEED